MRSRENVATSWLPSAEYCSLPVCYSQPSESIGFISVDKTGLWRRAGNSAAQQSGERQRPSVACQVHICRRSQSRTLPLRSPATFNLSAVDLVGAQSRAMRREGELGLSGRAKRGAKPAGCCAECCFQPVVGGKRACNVRAVVTDGHLLMVSLLLVSTSYRRLR